MRDVNVPLQVDYVYFFSLLIYIYSNSIFYLAARDVALRERHAASRERHAASRERHAASRERHAALSIAYLGGAHSATRAIPPYRHGWGAGDSMEAPC